MDLPFSLEISSLTAQTCRNGISVWAVSGTVGRGPRKPHDRVLVSAVNSVQRQFLPNGLPLMDASLMELPSTEKTGTGEESFGRLLG